jgi:hypothetical protein
MSFPAMQRHASGRSDASECVQHEPLTFCETMKPLRSPLDAHGLKITTVVCAVAAGAGVASAVVIAQRGRKYASHWEHRKITSVWQAKESGSEFH